jgi:hypothetical protein
VDDGLNILALRFWLHAQRHWSDVLFPVFDEFFSAVAILYLTRFREILCALHRMSITSPKNGRALNDENNSK